MNCGLSRFLVSRYFLRNTDFTTSDTGLSALDCSYIKKTSKKFRYRQGGHKFLPVLLLYASEIILSINESTGSFVRLQELPKEMNIFPRACAICLNIKCNFHLPDSLILSLCRSLMLNKWILSTCFVKVQRTSSVVDISLGVRVDAVEVVNFWILVWNWYPQIYLLWPNHTHPKFYSRRGELNLL